MSPRARWRAGNERKNAGIVLLCLVAGYLLLFGGASRERDRRRKITLEVATPDGPVRGAAVFEVTHQRARWWFPTGTGNRNAVGVHGEAPHVALGDGRHLFLTLNDPSHEKPIWEYFRPGAVLAEGNFAPGRVPLLITFGDIDDPNTIRRVAPDGFEAAFGARHPDDLTTCSDIDVQSANADGRFVHKDGTPYASG
jgi:hypothetical protein